jgi:hypothetical protein
MMSGGDEPVTPAYYDGKEITVGSLDGKVFVIKIKVTLVEDTTP